MTALIAIASLAPGVAVAYAKWLTGAQAARCQA